MMMRYMLDCKKAVQGKEPPRPRLPPVSAKRAATLSALPNLSRNAGTCTPKGNNLKILTSFPGQLHVPFPGYRLSNILYQVFIIRSCCSLGPTECNWTVLNSYMRSSDSELTVTDKVFQVLQAENVEFQRSIVFLCFLFF